MATTTTRDILKSYFQTGKYPTEEQFAELIDSMRHQSDVIGMDKVNGLYEALNGKADKAQVDLKDYAEAGKVLPLGGCYVYYGMPTHARVLDALDTDFNPGALEGDTTEVIVFCCVHGDDSNSGKGGLYLVYGSTNNGFAYYARFTRRTVPEDIQRAFGEAVATTSADGLMSSTDKQKLDELPTNAQLNTALAGKASTDVATTERNGLMSKEDKLFVGNMLTATPFEVEAGGTASISVPINPGSAILVNILEVTGVNPGGDDFNFEIEYDAGAYMLNEGENIDRPGTILFTIAPEVAEAHHGVLTLRIVAYANQQTGEGKSMKGVVVIVPDLKLATTASRGLMSKEDKTALEGLNGCGLSVASGKLCQTYVGE